MTRNRTLLVALLALLVFGVALYRWTGAEVAPAAAPAAVTTIAKYVLSDLKDPARASFRFAIAVAVSGMQAGDQLEAQFENPADAAQTLAGSVMDKPGVPKDQFMFVSPELGALQCRVYDVTVRLYRAGEREPVAIRREKIRSSFDSALIAAGGSDAARRVERGESVCGG